jgi:hypothetical protein
MWKNNSRKLVQQLLSKIGIYSRLYQNNSIFQLKIHRKNDSSKFLGLIKPVIKVVRWVTAS